MITGNAMYVTNLVKGEMHVRVLLIPQHYT